MKKGQISMQGIILRMARTSMLVALIGLGLSAGIASATCSNDDEFTDTFRLQDCQFKATGTNPFFILQPGYHLVLASEDGEQVEITVLSDTQTIHLDGKNITARVVEERESEEGFVFEISRNFFAICAKTNDVFYFGEDVSVCDIEETGGFAEDSDTMCANGGHPDNPGEWRAGVDGALPGVIMPGGFLLGSKYFQEVAFPVAADRAENVEMGLDVETEAGDFEGCVKVVDTNSVENICMLNKGDTKIYCPGVGLVQDEELKLTEIN